MKLNRSFLVRRAEAMLRRADQPRFQMSMIVLVTGGVGFLVSFLLLRLGLDSMALRYPLAVLGAYLAFLALLWLWLRYQGLRIDEALDTLEPGVPHSIPNAEPAADFTPGGGQFGGGGATASFDDINSPAVPLDSSSVSVSSAADVSWDFGVDLDELGLVLIALAIVFGAVVASFYVIYIAPAFLAEILVDSILAGALFRRLKHDQTEHWLNSAVKKTWALTLGLAVLLSVLGFAVTLMAPQANSLGDLLR